MLQSPPPKPVHRVPDFKARFGVDQEAKPPKLTRLQARRQKRSRFTLGAVVFSLMLGSAGSAAFFIGKDVEAVSALIKQQVKPVAMPEVAQIPPPAPPAPVAKTTTAESPVVLPAPEPVAPPSPPPPVIAVVPQPAETVVEAEGETAETATNLATATPEVVSVVVQEEAVPAPLPPVQTAMVAPVVVAPPAAPVLVTGQVFRDCENCPDVVVVVPPHPVNGVTEVQVTRQVAMPDVAPFAIGRIEVTFDDWGRCMAGGGCSDVPEDAGWGRNARPVINVSHVMASTQYLAWLSRLTHATYRLPTAEEWDLAEAGTGRVLTLVDSQTVCQSGNYANAATTGEVNCADGFPTTAPAGSLKPNSLGLHDMRGNVWEWVSDCWSPGFTYKPKPSEQDCHKRLLRGGSWSSQALLSATPARGFEDSTRATKTIGFRVARTLP